MSRYPFERSERIMREIGAALVTWGEIESFWRMMLPRLLYRGFRNPREEARRKIGGRGDGELSIQEERGYALWDSLLASSAQLDLVLAIAPLVLTSATQAKGLAKLIAVGKATHILRAKRNAVAHSVFERNFNALRLTSAGVVAGEEILRAATHAHAAIRGQDLAVVIPQFREEFRAHREQVRDVWSWLWIGLPKDAGEPLPDKGRQQSKGRAPNLAGRAQKDGTKKRPRPPGSSQG